MSFSHAIQPGGLRHGRAVGPIRGLSGRLAAVFHRVRGRGSDGGTKIFLPEFNPVLVTLSAILILIPGYPVSVGVVELTTRHVVSGTANLMGGLVYLIKQFAGAWLGVGLVDLAWTIPAAAAHAGEPRMALAVYTAVDHGLCVVFQTGLRP